ncbi:MAG: hypothetical protein ABI670_12480 [Chloroflexota bacterium]
MEMDELTPAGTFVEFSWHSYDVDGPLDLTPPQLDVTDYFVAHGASRAANGDDILPAWYANATDD